MIFFINFRSRITRNISFPDSLGEVNAKRVRRAGSVKFPRQLLRAQDTCMDKNLFILNKIAQKSIYADSH